MKTNCVLLAAVLLIFAMWGAAQFVTVHLDHPYWPNAKYPPGGPKVWHRDIAASFYRGGIYLRRIVVDPGKGDFIDGNTRLVTVKSPGKNDPPFNGPHLYTSNGWYTIFLPFWLLALLPALWFAWRVYRARPDARGLPVTQPS